MPDIEKQVDSREIQNGDLPILVVRLVIVTHPVFKDARKPHLIGKGPAPAFRHAACTTLLDADINSNLSDKVQKTSKPRTRSAKYLLRQGPYVENWNSPGCELSELYGQKSPRSFSPSPRLSCFLVDPLSARQGAGEQVFRFLGKSPTLPAGIPCSCSASSSRTMRSPFLSSTSDLDKLKSPPILADFSDLARLIMQDLQPAAYSSNPSSATACTFWDIPVNLTPLRTAHQLERAFTTFCVDDMLNVVDTLSPPINTFPAPIMGRSQEESLFSTDCNRGDLDISAITQS